VHNDTAMYNYTQNKLRKFYIIFRLNYYKIKCIECITDNICIIQ